MNTPPRSEHAVSRVIYDGGQRFLRVTRDHAISELWLAEHEPGLYALWLRATSAIIRDGLAATIDQRFDAIEFPTPGAEPPCGASSMPSSSVEPCPGDQLSKLIEEYETRLIGTGGSRDSLNEFRAHIEAYIGWNELEQSSVAVAWHLRDWAEYAAPELLTAWQRDVLAYGDLTGGTERMAIIAAARGASRAVNERPETEPETDRQTASPTANRGNPVQQDAEHLRAVEAVPNRSLRAVPSTRVETTRLRAVRANVAPMAGGRPLLSEVSPSRTPRR
jgi:hypothetical protein